MPAASFTRTFLLMFSGPLIWTLHFLIIYAVSGIVCARRLESSAWLGIGVMVWIIGCATVIMVAAIFWIMRRFVFGRDLHGGLNTAGFIGWMTAMLGLLSIIAMLWETLPVFIMPLCE